MESIEQPVTFDSLHQLEPDVLDTVDKTELIDGKTASKHAANGDSPGAECSPLHQQKLGHNSLLHGPQNYGLRVIIVSSVVFAVAVTVALILTIYLEPKQVRGHAAVACEDERCSQMALQILRDGGNAVDAAITASFCLSVVSPHHSGLGGGGFALVHDHKFTKSFGYNFRESAPSALKESDLTGPNLDESILTTGVPGFLKGLAKMHQDHGKLKWADLLTPVIDLAEFGFTLGTGFETALHKMDVKTFQDSPNLSKYFLGETGQFKEVNDTIVRPDLARTLKSIQADSDALYHGTLMTEFVNEVAGLAGKISAFDMRNYTVLEPSVVKSTIKGLTVLGLPAPASGPILALILNMADQLGWTEKVKNDSFTYHQLIETFKFANAHRSLLGDPMFSPDVNTAAERLVSKELAKALVEKMDNTTHTDPSFYGQVTGVEDQGTTHISIIDSSELMVSISTSINLKFGNQILLDSGIVLNNELLDFSLPAKDKQVDKYNQLAAGKRPLSSMVPTVVYSEEHPCAKRLIVGGINGSRITTGVAEVIINSVLFHLDLADAVAAPRVHSQLYPSLTVYEEGIPAEVVKDLEDVYQHEMKLVGPVNYVLAVQKVNDDIHSYADYRSHGKAAHY